MNVKNISNHFQLILGQHTIFNFVQTCWIILADLQRGDRLGDAKCNRNAMHDSEQLKFIRSNPFAISA